MNWELLDKVDVETIALTGDTASIEYLIPSLAFANLTQADCEHIPTRAALHAFQLLQLGTEYLLSKQQPPSVDPSVIQQYEAKIKMLEQDIQARDLVINNLTDQLKHKKKTKRTILSLHD